MAGAYWPQPWTCEDGGPRRWGSAPGQAGLGIAAGERLEVAAVRMPVASAGDVLATKLLAITEQNPDYKSTLELARALREQIDWDAVRAKTCASPFARAFFTLVEELEIAAVPAPPPRRLTSVER